MLSRLFYNSIALLGLLAAGVALVWFFSTHFSYANNIQQYKDTITNSAPGEGSNHTLAFRIDADAPAGSVFEITLPSGFTTIASTTFSENRNVEMSVGGVRRSASDTLSGVSDKVEIIPGTPGLIRYTLNTTAGIVSGSMVEIKIGNHTHNAEAGYTYYDDLLEATTTIAADVQPIINATSTGTKRLSLRVYDGIEIAGADFLIALVDKVTLGPADTTETVPPDRSEGQPSGIISGLSLYVEISLETNEFANCRYSVNPNTAYVAMSDAFENTGLIFHSTVVPITPDATSTFYVRCIDDENNMNLDDYVIAFYVSATPSGVSNTDGDVEGDGTGTGNNGSGNGSEAGGDTGSASGVNPTTGGSSGSGGSGGGSGGGASNTSGGGGGGGFETSPGPYESGDGRVVVSGLASPGAKVYMLIDGTEADHTNANSSGTYEMTVDGIARGPYTFGIYAIDKAGVKTTTFSTTFTVSGARASALSNINLTPSVKVAPNPATPGLPVVLSGYTFPNASITVEHELDGQSSTRKQYTATAASNGQWSVSIDTAGMGVGTYKVRTKATLEKITTNFSSYTTYGLGQEAAPTLNTDLSRDGKVNLTDFSILLYWWGSAGGASDPPADMNGDGKVNLTDFSILLFNWTG